MAYGNPGNPGPMTGNSGASSGMESGGGGPGVIHIGPDMLPQGMKLNKGDIVEFRVTGDQDEDGDWPIEYNYGEEGKEGEASTDETSEDKGTDWETDFRKSMSPRSEAGEGEPM